MITLPINPALPDGFDQTPNEDRSDSEILTWWDQPYAVKREDGCFDVRCLDGGAWDRPTYYGVAKTIEEAEEMAKAKLAAWQQTRSRPKVFFGDDGKFSVVLMPQSPREEMGTVIFFVCKALVDFSTAPLAAPCAGHERAARWESRSHSTRLPWQSGHRTESRTDSSPVSSHAPHGSSRP
jgi:hypothetical protein